MITKNEIENSEVRALSWKQPYADLMLIGKQETRKWKTNYRGLVLICSSKEGYSQAEINTISGKKLANNIDAVYPSINALKIMKGINVFNGKAIAVGKLINCRPMEKTDEPAAYVLHKEGLYLFEFTEVTPIIPFDWKGSQGWQILNNAKKEQIKLCF